MLKREGNKRLGNDMAQKGRSWVRIQQKIIKTMLPVIVTSHLVIELQTLTVLEACLKETSNKCSKIKWRKEGDHGFESREIVKQILTVVVTSKYIIYILTYIGYVVPK
jgi:uncharacterized membrane protein YdfJ with MMPL/SSD domain